MPHHSKVAHLVDPDVYLEWQQGLQYVLLACQQRVCYHNGSGQISEDISTFLL